MKEEERAKKSQAQEEERMTAEGGGFFASASQFQLTRPEMYEIHGPQFQNHYHNSATTPTALAWAQLLIFTPPSALRSTANERINAIHTTFSSHPRLERSR